METRAAEESDPKARGPWVFFLLALALGIGLRCWNAGTTSLWLDDFHSLHHARAASWKRFFEVLVSDNHPPLFFVILRGVRAVFGESELALRLPALATGFLTLGLLWKWAGALVDNRARIAALLWVGGSALHVDLSSNVRMYALLGLAVLGLVRALVAQLDEGRAPFWTAVWLAVGLHTHYHFVYAAGLLSVATGFLVLLVPRYRERMRSVLAGLTLGVLLALPWYLTGFRTQLEHALPPGGHAISIERLASGLMAQLHLGLGEHGDVLRIVFALGSLSTLTLALVGGLALLLRSIKEGRPASAVLLFSTAFGLPACAGLAAALSNRAGFEPRYLVGALVPLALLAAHGAFGRELPLARLRGIAGASGILTSLSLAVLLAASEGHENYRAAVAAVLDEARAEDALLAADWQPPIFPAGIGWEYYAGRVPAEERVPITRLEHDAGYTLVDPPSPDTYPRVFCMLRSIPHGAAMLRQLRSSYGVEQTQSFGRGVYVLTFERQ